VYKHFEQPALFQVGSLNLENTCICSGLLRWNFTLSHREISWW